MQAEERIAEALSAPEKLREKAPLVHCITSPIAINDCANAVLAVGAKPIMAEHPDEVAGITAISASLGVSLANITDARRESILIAGCAARDKGIFSVIDAVGVTCSSLRLDLANRFIAECHPAVIKGNASEIRALSGASFGVCGIDTAESDRVSADRPETERDLAEIVRKFAKETRAVVAATGATDLVSDGTETWALRNGSPFMGSVTGTGCILNCLTAAFLAVAEPLDAVLCAVSLLNIAGERAEEEVRHLYPGTDAGGRIPLGTFHEKMIDGLALLTGADLLKKIRAERLLPPA